LLICGIVLSKFFYVVVGVTHFRLSCAICLVGHVGTGDETTQKTENVHSNTSTATSVAKMSAVLTTDNYSKLTQSVYWTNRKRIIADV
jgi:hypothetical protein